MYLYELMMFRHILLIVNKGIDVNHVFLLAYSGKIITKK